MNALARPVHPADFAGEFRRLAKRAGIHRYAIRWPAQLDRVHCRSARRYAQVIVRERVFEFATAILWLPIRYRVGLIAHELGHVLAWPDGSERAADVAAATVLGVQIAYDKRWPGKGLQVAVVR